MLQLLASRQKCSSEALENISDFQLDVVEFDTFNFGDY